MAPHSDNFVALLLDHQSMIYRYAVTMTSCRADAEEIYQTTCLTLWEKWQTGHRPDYFGAWARGIAKNHVRNLARKSHRQPALIDGQLLERLHALREQHDAVLAERQAALSGCLEELSEPHRNLMEDYYAAKASIDELAEQQQRSTAAIYKMMQRIRAALFDCISRRLAVKEVPS